MDYSFFLRPPSPILLEEGLDQMYRFATLIGKYSPVFKEWYLLGDTKKEALQYIAIDEKGPTVQGLILLRKENKNKLDAPSFDVWNGQDATDAAKMSLVNIKHRGLSKFEFESRLPKIMNVGCSIEILLNQISAWGAHIATVTNMHYEPRRVFQDRPGVGWMIYLPHILTTDQVPEARKLVPVVSGKKQIGTIIVSVVDEPFDGKNQAHIDAANSIEVRLVDQDLLPLYAEY